MGIVGKLRIVRKYLTENGAMSEADIMEDCDVGFDDIDFLIHAEEIRLVQPECGGTGRWYAVA